MCGEVDQSTRFTNPQNIFIETSTYKQFERKIYKAINEVRASPSDAQYKISNQFA